MVVTAVLLPVAVNLARLSGRRIWAIARLSFKEALRRRVLWSFSALIVVFLFAGWFAPYKAEHQVANYVKIVFTSMTWLMLLTAALLAAFSIPADLRNQTMHTIVTKPIERFEIVLGRCFGYVLLLTLVLVVLSALSLVYVARGVNDQAREESLKARVPVFGSLDIKNPKWVGREWEYRQYIGGDYSRDRVSDDLATYSFVDLSPSFARRETVRCEFSFDIFRTTKGIQNRGVFVAFMVSNRNWDPKHRNDYSRERDQALANPDPALTARAAAEGWPADMLRAVQLSKVAEKYGYYEVHKEVFDYHTFSFELPGGLFRNLAQSTGNSKEPQLKIDVRCDSKTQYLGVARHDLYLLDAQGGWFTRALQSLFGFHEDSLMAGYLAFSENFFKGAFGLWLRLCLVIVVAVSLSTYLSGVIALLCTMFIYFLGFFIDFVQQLAAGKSDGGGPLEAMNRLFHRTNLIAPLDDTAIVRASKAFDKVFEFLLSRLLSAIPDVARFDLTHFVGQGFDISAGVLLWDNVVPLAGYLVAWLVLAFYLIQFREIAA
jgi:ABC-type transport system involved in multi-copper enzyme maturation permease subunit